MSRCPWFILAVLAMTMSIGGVARAQFDDQPKTDEWVYESFITVYEAGLLKGYPDGTFKGGRRATRYEMVEFMARLLRYFEERLSATEGDDLTEEKVEAMIAASFADHPEGLTKDEAKAMFEEALARRQAVTSQDVQAILDEAMAQQPPILTEDDVRRLIGEVLTEKKYLNEEEVKTLIAGSLAENGLTDEELTARIDRIYEKIQELEKVFYTDLEALDVRVTTLQEEVERLKAQNLRQEEAIAKLETELAAAIGKLQAAQEDAEKARRDGEEKAAREVAAAKEEAKKAKTIGVLGFILALVGILV